MNISPKLVRFDENSMWVELLDGRIIGVPLVWVPRLLRAQPEQLAQYELSQRGIHWDELDEDISIAGLLAGQGDITHRPHRGRFRIRKLKHVKRSDTQQLRGFAQAANP